MDRGVFGWSWLLLLGAIFSGCDSSGPSDWTQFEDLHPVQGKVLFRGEPIPDATIRFHPHGQASGSNEAATSAVVDEEGNFEVFTFRREGKGRGAAEGQYRVTVSWSGPLQGLTKDQEDELKERLPVKYTKPQTTPIEVDVVAGENRIDVMSIE